MIKKFTIEKITDITNTDVVMNYLKTLFKSIEIRLDGVVDEKTVSRKFNVEYESGLW